MTNSPALKKEKKRYKTSLIFFFLNITKNMFHKKVNTYFNFKLIKKKKEKRVCNLYVVCN